MEKELRIKLSTTADSKGIDNIKRSFAELERESLRTAASQRAISKTNHDAAQSVDTLSERIGFMGHAYVGFQAVVAGSSFMSDMAKSAIHQADTWNLLEGRLRLVTDSSRQLASVQGSLFDISQESRTGYEQNADLYARIARATQDLNKTQYENLDVTEAISKSFIVSGAASESAKAAVIQLGQGFASGTLRGEELNSVLEQAPRLAEAIADGMGVSVGKLKEMGAEGKLTAEKVYEAIRTQKNAIEKEFDQMPKTVAQSLVVLQNQIGLSISEFDKMHGVTSSIAGNITDLSILLSEHSGEIGTYAGYVGGAIAAILIWKAGTIAQTRVLKAYDAYLAASTIATTSYSIATNTTTTSVTTLTARQMAANVALSGWNKLVAINPYAIAGAAIIGVGLVLKNQADELRDSVKRTAIDVSNLSEKAIKAKITYATMQLGAVNDSINNPSIGKSLFGNERIDLNRRVQLENELKTYGKALQAFQDEANAPSAGGGNSSSTPLSEKELKAAAKAAKEYASNFKSLNDEIFSLNESDHDKALRAIDNKAKIWRDQKMPELEVAQYVSDAKSALNRKELKELGAMMNESRKLTEDNFAKADEKTREQYAKQIESAQNLYSAINDASGNWYDNEIVNISNRAAEFAAAGNDIVDIERYVSASILSIDEKRAKEQADLAQKTFEEQNKFWFDLMGNINKAMDDQFFNAMTGKFESFGSWLKDFWGAMTNSLARGLSKSLADAMIDTGAGGIQNIFKTFGGLGSVFGSAATPAALIGATTDSAGFTTTAGGTVMDAGGQVTLQGSDYSSVMDALNIASTANTAYSLLTGGLTAALYAPSAMMGQMAGMAYGAGLTGTGSFLAGGANVLAGGGVSGLSGAAYAGGLATAGIAGGIGGYAMGSIGDKLLGADTKAADYGAIGGAAGAMIGSVVPVVGTLVGAVIGSALGSLIGGAFGKTKTTGSGIQAWSDITTESGAGAVQSYVDFKKKSWFKSSSWTNYYGLSEKEQKAIEGMFQTYDYLLGQLGDLDTIVVSAGRYSGTEFYSAIDKSFIRAFVDNPALTDTFYSAWTEYASGIGKAVQETFATMVSGYVDYTRNYKTWMLESSGDTLESLRLQAEWAQGDLNAYSNLIGVSGVTIDNYLDMYSQAIKTTFTPESINNWQKLGDALKNSTELTKSYTDALKEQSTYIPADMMLQKVGATNTPIDIKQLVNQQGQQTEQTAQLVAVLTETVKVLKKQLTATQISNNQGVTA